LSRQIGDALRLFESADPVDHFAGSEIDDADAVIAKLGDEQPRALAVNRQMIDATGDAFQRNAPLQHQRLLRDGPGDNDRRQERRQHGKGGRQVLSFTATAG
jgi:hypothetical protein